MELFEDPVFKTKYTKSKFRVKQWESHFMDKYGRKPNKVSCLVHNFIVHFMIILNVDDIYLLHILK